MRTKKNKLSPKESIVKKDTSKNNRTNRRFIDLKHSKQALKNPNTPNKSMIKMRITKKRNKNNLGNNIDQSNKLPSKSIEERTKRMKMRTKKIKKTIRVEMTLNKMKRGMISQDIKREEINRKVDSKETNLKLSSNITRKMKIMRERRTNL
jgi:hypothetical protein